MDPKQSPADLFREEEEKQRYIAKFKEKHPDWAHFKAEIDRAYDYYKTVRDDEALLEEYFQQIGVTSKNDVFQKLAELSKPSNLAHIGQWLKFLGLIRPHKPKAEHLPVPKKEKRQLPKMPIAAEPGTYSSIFDNEGIGFPAIKKISKATGKAVW